MLKVRIWDLPTRIFHWTFAASCFTAWFTGDDARYTDLHVFAGYLLVALLLFRLVWGVIGGRYSRFTQFVTGPSLVIKHLRHMTDHHYNHGLGHNPAGAISVLLLLLLILLVSATGMVVLGGEEGFGLLAGQITVAEGDKIHYWHNLLAEILMGLVVLHVAGVFLMSLMQRENLPMAMINGGKEGDISEAEPNNAARLGKIMFGGIVIYSAVWFFPYLMASEEKPYLPFVDASLQQNEEWHDNCSSCHVAYHPSLLPLHSWQQLFDEEMHHFGEGLYLDIETMVVLRDYASKNSAEYSKREVSWRTLKSLGHDEHPVRISETPYWKEVHKNISKETWEQPPVYGKADCGACHMDAETGGFMNGGMHLP